MTRSFQHGLHKSYDLGRRKVEVLHGVSLEIGSGDFLSLQGASGAGKSTLLHLLGGLDEPSAGEVFADDQSLFGMGAVRLAKWRNREVGFVFQAYHLLPEFDALENVTLPGANGAHEQLASRSSGAGNCWSGSAWPSACITCQLSCPVASNNEWPLPGR